MTDMQSAARLPITTELRAAMRTTTDADTDSQRLDCSDIAFSCLCDAIDTVHANLERENESLRRELDRVLGEREDSREQHVVGSALVAITPQMIRALERDWHIEASWDGLRRFWHVGLTEEGVRRREAAELAMAGREKARPVIVSDEATDYATGSCACGACGKPIDLWDGFCRWCGAEVER